MLSQEFYAAIADGDPVDAALSEARMAVFASDNDVEWGTPVLYLRARDGRIFDIPAGAAQPQSRGLKPHGDAGVTATSRETPELSRLTIYPPKLRVGSRQRATVSGTFSNGTTKDLTGEAVWTSNDPSVVTIARHWAYGRPRFGHGEAYGVLPRARRCRRRDGHDGCSSGTATRRV